MIFIVVVWHWILLFNDLFGFEYTQHIATDIIIFIIILNHGIILRFTISIASTFGWEP
jgi:hypothetical protein